MIDKVKVKEQTNSASISLVVVTNFNFIKRGASHETTTACRIDLS